MKSLTFIEIDIPVCSLIYGTSPCTAAVPTTGARKCFNSKKTCQDRDNFAEQDVTLRFAMPTSYLPSDIDIVAPSISEVSFTPATISLGENLGQRATLSVVFLDHRHSDTGVGFDKYLADRDYNPFDLGTFWGKFRARHPFLRGCAIRWITGIEGQSLDEMETRHFVIESFDGPTPDGKYTLAAKDVLKLLDGDRSQAPKMNTGYLVAPITAVDTSLTLAPAGVGDAEYALTGYLALAGKEVVSFTRTRPDPAGENDSATKILLHMNGTNGSSTFTDDNFGGAAHIWTPHGATVTTSNKVLGTGALTGGYIDTPDHADFTLGSDDFTIECRFNTNGVGNGTLRYIAGQGGVAGTAATSAWVIDLSTGNKLSAFVASGGSTFGPVGTTSITAAGWHTARFVRTGNILKLFLDGVQEGGDVAFSGAANNVSSSVSVGRLGDYASNTFGQGVDEFRFDVGVARSVANYTPSSSEYTAHTPPLSTGDVITLTGRGQLGTVAAAFNAQDRVQTVLEYSPQSVATIINDLMVTYADVPDDYIPLSDWITEASNFLARNYSAYICEPTSVATLISELIQQACLVVWWDDRAEKVRLQVLRGIVTDAALFSPENTLQGSLTVKEQPDKRVSRVQVYFGRISPLKQLSDLENYRSSSLSIDDDAEEDYGAPVIKTILSRWIPELGRSVADRLGAIQLARFRDPPRKVTFDLARYAQTDPVLGGGYRIASQSLQDDTGALSELPVQVTRLNPPADRYKVEAEEVSFVGGAADLTRYVIVDSNVMNVNLRDAHDALYPVAQSGDVVVCHILAGTKVGSTSSLLAALDVGAWAVGVDITLIVEGDIRGAGGNGGDGYSPAWFTGKPGKNGGIGLYTRQAIKIKLPVLSNIKGGGGGGGGGGAVSIGGIGGAGGPGAGFIPGTQGWGPSITTKATEDIGGSAGAPASGGVGAGKGGDAGQPGVSGGSNTAPGGIRGEAGPAIDGYSYLTFTETGGTIAGPTIN